MYYKLAEFIEQPTKKTAYHNQDQKPSHILHNQMTTLPRIHNNIKLICTLPNCSNYRDKLGTVCYEHFKYKQITGTYNPSMFKFGTDVSKQAEEIYKSNFTSPTIELLISKIDKLFANPYSHTIEILKGSHKGSLCSSKEKISRYIKENYSKRTNSHHIAIRLGYVFKLYNDGAIEAGGELRFNLAKALIPHVSTSSQSYKIKEVIGNIALKNYIKELIIIADELNQEQD